MPILTITGTTDTQDCYLDQGSPTSNSDSADQLNIIAGALFGTGIYRSLIKFSLTAIPTGSTINSAVLTLFTGSDFSNRTGVLKVYRSLRAWSETEATWNVYTTGNSWATAGAGNTTTDRESGEIGSANTPGSTAADTQQDVTLTASLVQEMIPGGSFTNNGFVLKSNTETDADGHIYRSSEYTTDVTKIPKLVIDYSLAQTGLMTSFEV